MLLSNIFNWYSKQRGIIWKKALKVNFKEVSAIVNIDNIVGIYKKDNKYFINFVNGINAELDKEEADRLVKEVTNNTETL